MGDSRISSEILTCRAVLMQTSRHSDSGLFQKTQQGAFE
jgi:hypothetical protein